MRWDKRRLKRPQRCGDYRRAASQLGYSLLTQDPCYWDSRLEVLVWADLGGGTLPSVSSLYSSGQAAARVAATRPARRRFRTGARVGVRALGDRCAAGVTVGSRMMPPTVTWTDLGVRIVCTLIAGALIGAIIAVNTARRLVCGRPSLCALQPRSRCWRSNSTPTRLRRWRNDGSDPLVRDGRSACASAAVSSWLELSRQRSASLCFGASNG